MDAADIQDPPVIARDIETHGTRLIAKGSLLLRLIANTNHQGARLVDLTLHSGLERPTVRRILKGLMDEGLVEQDADNRRYYLGPLLFELGVAAVHRNRLTRIAAPALARIARQSGNTAYLVQRSGMDAVCIDTCASSEPHQVSMLDIGSRRPLGAAAGSLAILMRMPPEEQQAAMAANRTQMAYYERLTGESTAAALERCKRLGFALMPTNVMPYVSGVGVAIEVPQSHTGCSLSVSGLSDRIMDNERYLGIAGILRREAEAVATQLQA